MVSNVISSSKARVDAMLRKTVLFAALALAFAGLGAQAASPAREALAKYVVAKGKTAAGAEYQVINVPGSPPPQGYNRAAALPARDFAKKSAKMITTPAFDWTYGCSATSAGMMMGYYDRNGFTRIYTGPVNNGVCPLDNDAWGKSEYPGTTCGNCPIVATKKGIDARTNRGHVDDYWYDVDSDIDPYFVGKWNQHSPLDCTADFMGTNQYQNWGNSDGSTQFTYYTDGSPFYDPNPEPASFRDGCHGMRLFVESLGYNVTGKGNFNQLIDTYMGGSAGFTFADYMAEIDASRPVLIHVTGHTMLGVGYEEASKTIYLHNTWDYLTYEMTWGGSYEGRAMYGISVFRLNGFVPPDPGALAVSPSTLNAVAAVGSSPSSQKFNLWSTSTDNIDYNISISSSATDWLSCSPSSGTATSTASDITVNYSTAALAIGTYSGTITVSSATDSSVSATVSVALTIWDPVSIPKLEVSTTALSTKTTVGTNPAPLAFTLNTSSESVDYSISSSQGWVSTTPLYGTATTTKQTIAVNFNAADITTTGVYTAVLTITPASSAVESKYITVTLNIGALLMTSPTKLSQSCGLETKAVSQTFQVWNGGVGAVGFSINVDDAGAGWLSCAEKAGASSGPDDIQTIHVNYNTVALAAGAYTGKITVTDNANAENTKTISVSLEVSSGPAVIPDAASVDLNKAATFSLHNSGSDVVNFEVSDNATWFWCSPMTGSLKSGAGALPVTINYDTTLPLGTYTGVVTVTGRDSYGNIVFNSPVRIPVSLVVGSGPAPSGGELVPSVNNLNNFVTVKANAPTQIFQLTNSEPDTTRYYKTSVLYGAGGSWCACAPSSGALNATSPQTNITVSYQTSTLAVGAYAAQISIAETDASGAVLPDVPAKLIDVKLSVVEQPNLALMLSADSMKVVTPAGSSPGNQTFQVSSLGGAINFAVTCPEFWLSCLPVTGTCDSGHAQDIAISYNTASLADGTYKAIITVAPQESGSTVTPKYLTVTLVVGTGYSAPTLIDGIAFACSAGGSGVTANKSGGVSFVPDLTANITGASQRNASRQPLLLPKMLNSLPSLAFTGRSRLDLPQDAALNAAGPYTEKTVGLVFKTGSDIWAKQILFEQGDKNCGFNLYIEGAYVFVGAWNLKNSNQITPWGPVFLAQHLLTNTTYSVIMLYDQPSGFLKAYLNGSLFGSVANPGVLSGGKASAVIGGKGKGGLYYTSGQAGGLLGQIGEVWYYNVALGGADFAKLNDYFTGKYALNPSPMPLPEDNLTLWYRAYDEVFLSTGGKASAWGDSAGSLLEFVQKKDADMPVYDLSLDGQFPALVFDGVSQHLEADLKNKQLNVQTLFLAFKTGEDVSTRQIIWARGEKQHGMNVYLENGNVYMGCWSLKGKYAWGEKFINAPVKAGTTYCVEVDFDASIGTFKGAVNGVAVSAVNDVKPIDLKGMYAGGVCGSTYFHNHRPGSESYFAGALMEMIVYYAAVPAADVLQIQGYLGDRYGIAFPK